MMLAGQKIFKFYGWGVVALVTPTMLFVTGTRVVPNSSITCL